ncbi:helix-turn-helix domain-containing protein [Sphingomonas sp. HF-S4]|uniref:Helix-turn-helix domain-containing protein n=1 Tax=Sphingomonas agrestis TaxID=3080540 RepID=A0ABU3YBG2_9SPHN|nr:helix-turn-helix domain-containing protein [Sphingomonas sp. HF-S4]MDV3458730.1 helix-turn-helix domain-containing protein [Sphingomonas sp. HF-S4]
MDFLPGGSPRLDVMRADCRARSVLTVLAERWALLIIDALGEGPRRTSELRRRIGGISEKMLIQTLRRLEALGLIERRDYREVPPKVEYALTKRGASLSPIVSTLDRWVEENALDMLPGAAASTAGEM